MSKKIDWLAVDWVELGCRGWEIDESGAGICDEYEEQYTHLDRTTLDLILHGRPAWVRRVVDDLTAARLPRLFNPWSIVSNTITSGDIGTSADTICWMI